MQSDMKLIAVNIGLPRVVMSNGDPVSTGIFKEPVAGRVMLRALNLDGDRQADLSVHGGPSKAVYAYPSEHYEYWKHEFPEMKLPWGMFGENFTTARLLESELNIGDKFRVGSAIVMATEPRMPCYKLGIRFGRSDVVKRFLASERTGFYFAVLQEGDVGVGDPVELIERSKDSFKLSDTTALYTHEKHNVGLLRRAIEVGALPESWKSYFRHRLAKLTGPSQD
ncbi:MAG TPA: MOSC domain-containing protein [Candidatus Binatia bacterium]|jgi:MOSC domain-containing protein YiiM|nr:MOSC domain-containing protein [Candidatus Binatia bacterium]